MLSANIHNATVMFLAAVLMHVAIVTSSDMDWIASYDSRHIVCVGPYTMHIRYVYNVASPGRV